MKITVNGREYQVHPEPGEWLRDTLRDLSFTSVRCGCETTNCGLCTVLIDNTPYLSCAVLTSRVQGKSVETLEGVVDELKDLRTALGEEGGDQCGYCTPGLMMNVLHLKRNRISMTREELKDHLKGNLCRCTGFAAQIRAITEFLEGEG